MGVSGIGLAKLFFASLLVFFFVSGRVTASSSERVLPEPGLLPDNPFYFLKGWSESFADFLTQSDLSESERLLRVSETRLAEAKALLEKGKPGLAGKSFQQYENHLSRALLKAREAKIRGVDSDVVLARIVNASLRHRRVRMELESELPVQKPQGVMVSEEALEAISDAGLKKKLSNQLGSGPLGGESGGAPDVEPTGTISTGDCVECPIREYDCPRLVEYEFSKYLVENVDFSFGGLPVLELESVGVEDGKLVCHYGDTFVSPDFESWGTTSGFGIASISECPPTISLMVKEGGVSSDWSFSNFVKLPQLSSASGLHKVIMRPWAEDDLQPKEYAGNFYYGCVYSRTLEEDSNPDLRMPEDGVCTVNDEGNGFWCADSVIELSCAG